MKSEFIVELRFRRVVMWCAILATVLRLDRLSDWLAGHSFRVVSNGKSAA
jgi:hypothetical protein